MNDTSSYFMKNSNLYVSKYKHTRTIKFHPIEDGRKTQGRYLK